MVLPCFGENVDMILSTIDDKRDAAFAADRTSEVFMKPAGDVGIQPWSAGFCREDDVVKEVAV